MTRGILIAGNESSLFSAAAAEAVKRVNSFASAVIPNRFPLPGGSSAREIKAGTDGAIPLEWSPASPISARTLVLAAENRLAQINDAVVICSPPAVYKTSGALTPEEIEILVNDHIKGWFFLIRELSQYFRRTGSGSLSLVAPEAAAETAAGRDWGRETRNKNTQADLLGSSAAAAFRAFAQSILASSANEPFLTMGFGSAEAGDEGEFAAWFFKIVDEGARKNSGRWHKFSKMKFFR